jgi:Peptidase M10 serralysin C terminal
MGAERKHGNAKDAILTSGLDEDALTLLKSDGSLTNVRDLVTTGDLANGIYAAADRVTITNLGDIETNGLGAVAILVQGDDARVTNRGAIVTRGEPFNGGGGEITSEGIFVEGDRFSIRNFGTVETEGLGASALVGVGQGGEIVNFGEVNSHSDFALAVGAVGDGSAVTNRGQVTVTGDQQTGLFAAGDQYSIQNSSVVRTTGIASNALQGSGQDGEIVNNGRVIADSAGGFAISASGDAAKVINRGDVTIGGDQGIGLFADGFGSQLLNRGEIAVNAEGAVGVLALSEEMEVVNSGHIDVNAEASWGLFAGGFGLPENMQVRNSGRIEAHGNFAVGMEVQNATAENAGHIAAAGGATAAVIDTGATFENTRSGVVLSEDAASVAVQMNGGQLENSGLVRGAVAVLGSFGGDTVVNHGRLDGGVALGGGSDTFVFGARGSVKGSVELGDGPDRAIVENGAGVARIADFSPGHTAPDFVDVSAFYSGFGDLLVHAMQTGDDVVIKLDRDDKLVLEHVTLGDLEASNFIFAGDAFAGELNGLPTVSIEVLADYLVQHHVSDEVGGPQRWEGNTITINIDELNENERAIALRALDVWDDVVDLDFEFISAPADLTFHSDEFSNGTFVDWDGEFISSAEITVARFISPLDPLSIPETYLHEIGHALGLGHAGPYNPIWENQLWSNDTVQFTVMAGGRQDALGHPGSNIEVETPAMADILAMGTLYGFKSNHEGDTVYGFGNNTGQAAFDFSRTETANFTIYDTGGTDTLDASQYADNQVISLVTGTWSSIGPWVDNVGIYLTSIIENANGGSGDDTITGNTADNRIDGGGGNDTLVGGVGDDVFVFTPGFGADRIVDFDADPANGQDRIDISALDIASFAGEVVVTDLGADTLVSIGMSSILLVGVSGVGANAISQSDFLL